jgi:hypothetical protein
MVYESTQSVGLVLGRMHEGRASRASDTAQLMTAKAEKSHADTHRSLTGPQGRHFNCPFFSFFPKFNG